MHSIKPHQTTLAQLVAESTWTRIAAHCETLSFYRSEALNMAQDREIHERETLKQMRETIRVMKDDLAKLQADYKHYNGLSKGRK